MNGSDISQLRSISFETVALSGELFQITKFCKNGDTLDSHNLGDDTGIPQVGESRPGILLNILQCTGQLLTVKNHNLLNIIRAKMDKPCFQGFPGGSDGKESACNVGGKIPRGRNRQPMPVVLPGEFHGQRSLGSYSPLWGSQRVGHN